MYMNSSATKLRLWVGITPSFENLLLEELSSIGINLTNKVRNKSLQEGGIECFVSDTELWKIAFKSRLAESMRVRVGGSFHARNWNELNEGFIKLPWKAYLPGNKLEDLKVSVVCSKSALYHTNAVKERLMIFLQKMFDYSHTINKSKGTINSGNTNNHFAITTTNNNSNNTNNTQTDEQHIHVRITHDKVQVSVDAYGGLMYKRSDENNEKHVTTAPLRETIAAALLRSTGYHKTLGRCIFDPFCGSGTILQEAIGLSLEKPTFSKQRFAFESWKIHNHDKFQEFVGSLEKGKGLGEVYKNMEGGSIIGSDIDKKSISACYHNFGSAGYFNPQEAEYLKFYHQDFEDAEKYVNKGSNFIIVSNLPYGYRVLSESQTKNKGNFGINDALRDTYYRFGKMLERRTDFEDVYVLSGNKAFTSITNLSWETVLSFQNHGLPVEFLKLSKKK